MASPDDITINIKNLLLDAISIAETNDHFEPDFSTAEVYYYWLRLAEQDKSLADDVNNMCKVAQNVIRYRDRTKNMGYPRHQAWANYAINISQVLKCP